MWLLFKFDDETNKVIGGSVICWYMTVIDGNYSFENWII